GESRAAESGAQACTPRLCRGVEGAPEHGRQGTRRIAGQVAAGPRHAVREDELAAEGALRAEARAVHPDLRIRFSERHERLAVMNTFFNQHELQDGKTA